MLAYRILGPVLVITFLISGVGGGNDTPSDGVTYYLAAGGWFAFGITLFVTVLFTIAVVAHAVRSRVVATD